VVTGDTKVVERGKADGAFLTTSGIGLLMAEQPIGPGRISAGDQLVVSGDLGRHGMAILMARHGLDPHPPLLSDCAPLWPLVEALLARGVQLHCLRDLTRGGLASALHELAMAAGLQVRLSEERIPVSPAVRRGADLLGLDPLHLANEGRMVVVVDSADLEATLAVLEPHGGAWIGAVEGEQGPAGAAAHPAGPRLLLRTAFGSERVLSPPAGDLLPRIC
jgi:hydrogenase expression/formation protein HypE